MGSRLSANTESRCSASPIPSCKTSSLRIWTEAGFTGFERGVLGSTAENLSSLDYQIQKDKERLADIQERIEAEQVRYEPAHEVRKTMAEMSQIFLSIFDRVTYKFMEKKK